MNRERDVAFSGRNVTAQRDLRSIEVTDTETVAFGTEAKVSELINNKYVPTSQLGKGNFGTVFKGINQKTREHVAVKIEHIHSPAKILKHETTILNYLYRNGCRSAPAVYWYGQYKEQPCLVMPFYDCSLFDYSQKHKLSMNQINALMLNIFNMLENIHSHFVIHRDIKPHNFMLKNGELYIIDFGLAAIYTNEKGEHLPKKDTHDCIIGTPKYISINIHNGDTPSRRDDIISTLYIYLLLLFGYLPWSNIWSEPEPLGASERLNSVDVVEGVKDRPFDYVENANVSELHISHYKNQIRKQMKELENMDNEFRGSISRMDISYNDPNKFTFDEIYVNIYKLLKYTYQLKYSEKPNYSGFGDFRRR